MVSVCALFGGSTIVGGSGCLGEGGVVIRCDNGRVWNVLLCYSNSLTFGKCVADSMAIVIYTAFLFQLHGDSISRWERQFNHMML